MIDQSVLYAIAEKLSDVEVGLLEQHFGVDFTGTVAQPRSKHRSVSPDQAAAIREKGSRLFRQFRGEPPHCSFCDCEVSKVGKMCQSEFGPYICKKCAVLAIELIDDEPS